VIAGVFAPVVNAVVPFAAGYPSTLHPFSVGSLWAPIVGGITAAVTMALAQRVSRRIDRVSVSILDGENVDDLVRLGSRTVRFAPRQRI
jgi:hypothetical protein